MTITMHRSAPLRESAPKASRPEHVSRAARLLADRIGCTVLTAQRHLNDGETSRRMAAMLSVRLETEDHDAVHQLMAPIDQALTEVVTEEYTVSLRLEAQLDDIAEDAREAEHTANECDETFRRWVAARAKARASNARLDRALVSARGKLVATRMTECALLSAHPDLQ